MKQEQARPQGILDLFFNMGKNLSPEKQMDWTYYMIWIIFLAFASMFITNILRVINGDWYSIIWAGVGFAVGSLQYITLSKLHAGRKTQKELLKDMPKKDEKIDSVDEMLNKFKEMKGGKISNGIRKKKESKRRRYNSRPGNRT